MADYEYNFMTVVNEHRAIKRLKAVIAAQNAGD